MLLVVVSSVAAAAAFRLGVKRGTPVPPPPKTTAAPSAAEPPPEPEAAAPKVEPVVDEPVPEPGTPEGSLRARPSWGRLGHDAGASTDEYAPQPSKPLEVFLASAPMTTASVDRAFVICRFQSFNKADTFAGDDLHVRATFGRTPEVAADGPEDGNLGFASAPLVTMKRGDTMRFEVHDRDVFGMTLLSRPVVRFAGGPVSTIDAGAAIECRQLGGSALAHTVSNHAAHADSAVGTLARHKLDGTRPDWGYPTYETGSARRAIGDVAALAGWSDARVTKRVAALDAAVVKVDAQRASVFGGLHAKARSDASFEDFDIALGAVDCHGAACTVHLTVTNRRNEELRFGGFSGPRAYIATPASGPVATQVSATIAPKSSAEVLLDAHDVADGPAIVSICARGTGYRDRCIPLRLR